MTEGVIPTRFPATGGDIVGAAMSPMMEMSLGSRLVFAERLDPDVLSRATRLLLDIEPILGCWYDEKLRGADWVRCSRLDESAYFSMADSADPDGEAAAFHGDAFEREGPRLAILLLRVPDHDELCVRLDHVAGDGWCAKEVTHLLAETYTRLLDDPDYLPTPRTSPRPTHGDVWRALTDEQRAAAASPPPFGRSKWKWQTHPDSDSGFTVRTLAIPPERVAAIRAYAHERGGTVNEALVASFVRSAATIFPPPEVVRTAVSISADTRRMTQGVDLDRVAMIATTQNVEMDYRHGEVFEGTLRKVIAGIKPHKDTLWNIGGTGGSGVSDKAPPPMLLRAVFGFMVTMMRATHLSALATMNIGPFDAHRLTFGEARPISALVTGPIPRFPGFAVTISYYRDTLTLWMGFRRERVAPELVERFLDGIDEQLADAVGSAPAKVEAEA